MARENQGLQIALILFVMFTLIFGVTTFIFYKQYDEANTKAAKDALAAATETKAVMEDEDEAEEIRKSAEVDKENRKLVSAAVKTGNVGLLVAAMNVVDDQDERGTGPHMRVKLSATKDMEKAARAAYKQEARLKKEGKLKRERGVYTADSAKEAAGEDEDEEDTAVGSEADSEDTSDEDDGEAICV